MASPIVTPFAAPAEMEYRPISRIAIIGLILSLFSPLLFLTDNGFLWLIFFVIPGAVLSILARRAVMQSEGSLAGEALANLGIILSVCCGLGWMTSRLVSVYVTDMEARDAIETWIDQMQSGKSGTAFLYTMQPKLRNLDFNPEDHRHLRLRFPNQTARGSLYDAFVVNPIYSQLLRYGKDARMTYLSQVDNTVYRGTHTFRLRYDMQTPIANGEVIFVAKSEDVDTDQGVRRQWSLAVENSPTNPPRSTQHGEELLEMINQASAEVNQFVMAIANAEQAKLKQMLVDDPQKQGEFQQVFGYLRSTSAQGPVLMGLMLPMQLAAEQKIGNEWKLTFDCTVTVVPDREVDFSLVASKESSPSGKWKLSGLKFVGMHKTVHQLPSTTGPGQSEEGTIDTEKGKASTVK
jgi:hypothetical protein